MPFLLIVPVDSASIGREVRGAYKYSGFIVGFARRYVGMSADDGRLLAGPFGFGRLGVLPSIPFPYLATGTNMHTIPGRHGSPPLSIVCTGKLQADAWLIPVTNLGSTSTAVVALHGKSSANCQPVRSSYSYIALVRTALS